MDGVASVVYWGRGGVCDSEIKSLGGVGIGFGLMINGKCGLLRLVVCIALSRGRESSIA